MPRPDLTATEPVLTTSVVTSLVSALIGVIVAAGIPVSSDLKVAITVLAIVAVKTAGAFYARSKVKPVVPRRTLKRAP